ncbi:aspartic proteinase CDR1-like [Vigna umbellata]|uniref:aspartic proteinase CDR1-like n=1 Tax=Vigna umbellata TaxID=87088 RepID=UPI001F5F1AE6|nr:aspartic proteinase CDR1-like [Vigna umbellata]
MNPSLFFCLAAFSVYSLSSAEADESPSGFTVDLIHRDSPLSPFYNPSLTPSQRIINAALRSNSRLNRLSSHRLDQTNKLPQSILVPDNGEYLMKFYIGTPPVERLAIADTGSDLIWVQCSPCASCFPQDTPLFEPLKSSTFVGTTCGTQPCTLLQNGRGQCGNSGECVYLYEYGDNSFSAGLLSTETLTFDDSQGGAQTVSFPNTIFGCGLLNNFTVYSSTKLTGLVGLGAGPLSLVSQIGDQIGHKFSYCLLPFSSTSSSKLRFGNEAIITGNGVVSTPMIIKPSLPTFYFLNLEAVTVAQKTVPTGGTEGNVIIDSGTVLTYLEPTFFSTFAASLQEALGVELVQEDIPSPLNFCFPYRENFAFPEIAFQFTGATVPLKPINLLIHITDRNMLCLTIVPSTMTGISIIGSFSQFNFHVVYDLEGKKVSFHPTDCSGSSI